MAIRKISMGAARKDLAKTVGLATGGDRVAITRHKKVAAVMVSVEDYRFLRSLEDRADLKAARKAAQEPGSVPWERVKAELGL